MATWFGIGSAGLLPLDDIYPPFVVLIKNSLKHCQQLKKGGKMKKHILNIGLNDKDSKIQEVDEITAFKIVLNLTKKYYSGGSITKTTGFYTHESGEITTESGLELTILEGDTKKTALLIADIKTALNQESILLQVIETNAKFI